MSERRRRRRRRRREVDRRLLVLIWTSLEKTDPSLDLVPFAGTTSVRRTRARTLVEKIENLQDKRFKQPVMQLIS